MEKLIKVGKMPGRIVEVVIGEGATIKDALSLAELNNEGFDIKLDGNLVQLDTVIGDGNLIILAQRVKGNADKLVKVGKMPGRIVEVVVNEGATVNDALNLAELNAEGFDIKVDGNIAKLEDTVGDASLIILAQRVKGNTEKLVKVGKMPGRIVEVVATTESTVSDVIGFAELDSEGFDIKVDGNIAQLSDVIGDANLIILAQRVKGN